jgi:uncharacterized protein (TIGR02996 family)
MREIGRTQIGWQHDLDPAAVLELDMVAIQMVAQLCREDDQNTRLALADWLEERGRDAHELRARSEPRLWPEVFPSGPIFSLTVTWGENTEMDDWLRLVVSLSGQKMDWTGNPPRVFYSGERQKCVSAIQLTLPMLTRLYDQWAAKQGYPRRPAGCVVGVFKDD